MAILSRVSQRALWVRRISSMPVSTSVGAEVPGKPRIVFIFKIGPKLTSNEARTVGLVTVVSLGVP